jgi:hypothetical protein
MQPAPPASASRARAGARPAAVRTAERAAQRVQHPAGDAGANSEEN